MKRPAVGLTFLIALLGAACAGGESTSDPPVGGNDPTATRDHTPTSPAVTADPTEGTVAPSDSTIERRVDPGPSPTSRAVRTTSTTSSTTVSSTTQPPTTVADSTSTTDRTTGETTTTSVAPSASPTSGEPPASPDAAAIDTAYTRITSGLDVTDGLDVPLANCPLDPDDTIVPDLFGSLELSDGVGGLPVAAGAFDVGQGYGTMIYCDRFPPVGDDGVGVFAVRTPDDFEAYTTAFADPGGPGAIAIEITPLGTVLQGGDLLRICVTVPDQPGLDYCEIDWAIGRVTIGAYVNGPLTRTVDLDAFQAAFVERTAALAAALVAS